jgi:hypothetical protein|tara:strand:+ start:9638 stop:9928 length:291 start_codon:yes stop_codon:yes gene_type:complete
MEVITIDSELFSNIQRRLDNIERLLEDISDPVKREANEWLSAKDVQQYLKISERTVYTYQSEGKLKPVKIKGYNYFHISQVRALLNVNAPQSIPNR